MAMGGLGWVRTMRRRFKLSLQDPRHLRLEYARRSIACDRTNDGSLPRGNWRLRRRSGNGLHYRYIGCISKDHVSDTKEFMRGYASRNFIQIYRCYFCQCTQRGLSSADT